MSKYQWQRISTKHATRSQLGRTGEPASVHEPQHVSSVPGHLMKKPQTTTEVQQSGVAVVNRRHNGFAIASPHCYGAIGLPRTVQSMGTLNGMDRDLCAGRTEGVQTRVPSLSAPQLTWIWLGHICRKMKGHPKLEGTFEKL